VLGAGTTEGVLSVVDNLMSTLRSPAGLGGHVIRWAVEIVEIKSFLRNMDSQRVNTHMSKQAGLWVLLQFLHMGDVSKKKRKPKKT